MLGKDIRNKFLEFFRSKNHTVVESDSLVPKADPTLLFTSAGMNQFKEQFLGHNVTYKRATTCQKCLRTADLENVGKTAYHHTFFEMLGNFSFGDYFKKEAIGWGWEFVTEVLGLKKERLWVSVYEEDDESYRIWKDAIKVPKEKIVKLGAKENFWPSNAPKDGPNGPCGPCSEIFYDWGKDAGCGKKACDPSCDCGRFVEVWNLVFTQFERKEDGSLKALPKKNIDTGMGLERIAAVMQKVRTNFDTDLFAPIIEEIKKHSEKLKKESLNAIADHLRAATFAIADGVAPSNEERGYVIRKLIRRAYLRGTGREPFLYKIVPKIADVMKDAYPELIQKREEISLIVKEEEERFGHTLLMAMPLLKEKLEAAKTKVLEGKVIFKLVDTYGLPLEVIENEAAKRKIKLDRKTFQDLMENRRELSRKKSKIEDDIFALSLFAKAPDAPYSDEMPLKAKIAFIVKEKDEVEGAQAGETVELMTNPESAHFYKEAGGQLGDTGFIEAQRGRARILNTVKVDNKAVHLIKVIEGAISKGENVTLSLDIERKKKIAKNHTATHLLHSALRGVLGEHVHQAGSLVDENRLRFDFTHMKKLTQGELERVEEIVNECIKKAEAVKKEEKTLGEARAEGAIALFGEKYEGNVRVVTTGSFSKEVCGGTHVDNTKDIEIFRIVRESSVASGVRRIEAVTSTAARKWMEENAKKTAEKEEALKKKETEKKLEKTKLKEAEANIDDMLKKCEEINGTKVVIEKIENANMTVLRNLSDRIKSQRGSFFIALVSAEGNKANLILSMTNDLVKKETNASSLIKELAEIVEGSGGGRPDFAQAGGKNISKLKEAMERAGRMAKDIIGGAG